MKQSRHQTRDLPHRLQYIAGACLSLVLLFLAAVAGAQDNDGSLGGGFDEDFQIPLTTRLCFGISGISEPRALEICDALQLRENVRARELAQSWIEEEPDSPAAHYSLAEVLSQVEGNLPRALFHLHRAEEMMQYQSLGRVMEAGNLEWHYLTLNRLSYLHQLIGNQHEALAYLDIIEEIYGQSTEAMRGWPLIKLERYEDARASAERVLSMSDDPRDRSRAWNTLCAVELADLRPLESLAACENAMSEEEGVSLLEDSTASDTVHLLNASEVSLSLLRFQEAEQYLDRATRFLNSESVGNPWVYKLYLYMNQGRLDEARQAVDNMLVWRNNQSPMITTMNRAEHLMVKSMFLLLAGYPEDAARLTRSALNQPDRTGSYSADEEQKDSIAALVNKMAHDTAYQLKREEIATMGFFESIPHRFRSWVLRFNAWRSGRQAASLFADRDTLMNRLRPYAPLDVHIPEWVEPELVALLGPGTIHNLLEETHAAGAFALNEGYYHATRAEVARGRGQHQRVIDIGTRARNELPSEEVLLRARLAAIVAQSAWQTGQHETALDHYEAAMRDDPSILRRLGASLPVTPSGASGELGGELMRMLRRSPRFTVAEQGFALTIGSDNTLCLLTRDGDALSCIELAPDPEADEPIADLALRFHAATFSPGFEITRNQRLALLGGGIIGRNLENRRQQQARDTFMGDGDRDAPQ